MLMILMEWVTRLKKSSNVETYTAVQLKQKYGDYQGNKSIEEALKAKEHAFKGGAKNNSDLTCFSHVAMKLLILQQNRS